MQTAIIILTMYAIIIAGFIKFGRMMKECDNAMRQSVKPEQHQ